MKFKVNKELLPLKAYYFLFNAGMAPVVPFMPTFARQLGFSATVVGSIYTVLPIAGMLMKPIFGAIADRFQRQKMLFMLFQLLTVVSFFCILFIPAIPQHSTVTFNCNDGAADLKYCKDEILKADVCLADIIEGSDANSTLRCKLDCVMDKRLWDIVCENWNITTSCPKSRSGNLVFETFIRTNQMEIAGNCFLFNVKHGSFPDNENAPLYCPHAKNESLFSTSCEANCDNPTVTELITESKIPNNEIWGLYQFWLLFLFLLLSWSGMAVVVSVGDAICFEMLGDKPHLYGNQRLWGAVGWGIFSVMAGLLVDAFSKGASVKNYSVAFYMMAVFFILGLFVSKKLKYTQSKMSTSIIKDVRNVFTSVRVVIFFLWCIAVGMCTAMIWNFLFWHLEDLAAQQDDCDSMLSMKTLQGLVSGIQCFGGELPFFFLSGWILKKIGHIHAMSLVLLGFGVRFLLYSVLVDPWWVLPIEFMNGITFGIFYSTMTSYASIVAPPGTEATIQGLVGAIFEGVGVSSGSFLAGHLVEKYGGSQTFRYFGISALVLFLIHIAVQRFLESTRGNTIMYATPSDAITIMDDQEPLGLRNQRNNT